MRLLIKGSSKNSGKIMPLLNNLFQKIEADAIFQLYHEVKDNDYPNTKNTETKLQTKEKSSTKY